MGGWGQPSRMCLSSLGRVREGSERGQDIWEDRQMMTGVLWQCAWEGPWVSGGWVQSS